MKASVVALRLGRLGDLIMTLPALQWLSASAELEVTLVTDEHYQELLAQLLPEVRVVASGQLDELGPFDAVLDLHRVVASGKVRRRLRRRPGAAVIRVRKQSLLRHHLLSGPRTVQLLQRPVVAALGGLSALQSWPERHLGAARELFTVLGVTAPARPLPVPAAPSSMVPPRAASAVPVLGLVVDAGWPLKRWPVESFRDLSLAWHDACGGSVRLFAGPGEVELLDAIGELPAATRSVGGSLLSLARGLGACDVIVAADTGPLHLSAALGRPVVGMFGPTPVDSGFWVWGDRGVPVRREVDCSPCSLHGAGRCRQSARVCMEDLGVQQVLEAVLALRERERRCA